MVRFFTNLIDIGIGAVTKGQPLVFSFRPAFCRYFAKFQINIDEPVTLFFI